MTSSPDVGMSPWLLRAARRRTAWEKDDPHELCRVEFRQADGAPDLAISVYETPRQHAQAIQVYAEHAASVPLDPPRGATVIDLSASFDGDGQLVRTPGESSFVFTRDAHREIRLADKDSLTTFATRLLATRGARLQGISKVELRDYVRTRLVSGDPEWTRYCDVEPKGGKWRAFAGQGPGS